MMILSLRHQQVLRKRMRRYFLWRKRLLVRFGVLRHVMDVMIAAVVLLGMATPVITLLYHQDNYRLSADTLKLIGEGNQTLSKQLTYNAATQTYEFNTAGMTPTANSTNPTAALMQAQTGAAGKGSKSLYALDIPQVLAQGVTYHDTNTQLSFTLTPEFSSLPGQESKDHLVYPLSGGMQAIYTLKNNGLKEDIIVPERHSDQLRFTYKLSLPNTLAARIIPGTNNIGIYSADPSLYGNISYGTSGDQVRVMKARETSPKNHLLFGLPAPVVKDAKGIASGATAKFELSGNTLTVVADHLAQVKSQLTIDPSVVITSSSDFGTAGNNEGNIDFSTSDQINRARLTGGGLSGGWSASSTSFSTARSSSGSVAYNGYLYAVGGYDGTTYYNDVQYAPINSDGTLGTWVTSANNFSTARSDMGVVAYSGYLYIIGGDHGTSNTACAISADRYCDDIQYAPLSGSDGSVGAWTTSTNHITTPRSQMGAAVYNGYVYIGGGLATSLTLTDIQYAPLNGDGSVGAWTTSTNHFQNARRGLGLTIYGSNLYILGGVSTTTGTYYNDVKFANIYSDGSISAFTTDRSFSTARSNFGAVMYDGYVYIYGGTNGSSQSSVQYAAINADGTLGPWQLTSSFAIARTSGAAATYNGYIYFVGGTQSSGTAMPDTALYAKIDDPGMLGQMRTSSGAWPGGYVAHRDACSTVYNGTIYVLGGTTGTTTPTYTNDGYYTTISSTGDVGTWTSIDKTGLTSGTNIFQPRADSGCIAASGYLFIAAGRTATSSYATSVWKIKLNSDGSTPVHVSGTENAWSSTTSIGYTNGGRAGISLAIYNSRIYAVGGNNATTWYTSDNIRVNTIDAFGNITGTWSTAYGDMPNAHSQAGVAVVGNYLYVMGGADGSSSRSNVIDIGTMNKSTGVISWSTSSTTLPASVVGLGAAGYNGYLYITGGYNGTSYLTTTYFAKIDYSNGTITGGWKSGPNLSVGRAYHSVVAGNGFLYSIDGQINSSFVNTTTNEYALINNGGSGVANTWATSASTLYDSANPTWANTFAGNQGLSGAVSVVNNGYLYVMGGTDNVTYYNTVEYTYLNRDGTFSGWTNTSAFTTGRTTFGGTICDGYVYIAGGTTSGGRVADVQYAKINNGGSLGTFNTTTSLPNGSGGIPNRAGDVSVCVNGYVYVLGGYDGSARLTDVVYAKPNATTGAIASWSSTTAIPGNSNMAVVSYNGYIYMLGGSPNSGSVYYAKANSDGTVGTWNTTSAFAGTRYDDAAVTIDGYVYLIGGTNGTTYYNDTQFAAINPDGTLGPWQTSSNTYTTSRYRHTAVAANGRIYVIGGANSSGTTLKDIQDASVNVLSRDGQYSKLIDLGSVANIGSITYDGILASGDSNITYRVAGGDGVFGSVGNAHFLVGAGTCVTGTVTGRYILVSVLFDSSQSSVFPDSEGTSNPYLTDFAVNYSAAVHPATNIRLRGGASFVGQSLQTLDTCGVGGTPLS